MSENESEYWSDVDNFPLHTKLVRNCLDMRTGKKGEHAHIVNVRSNAKNQTSNEQDVRKIKKVESLHFTQELYKKQPMTS